MSDLKQYFVGTLTYQGNTRSRHLLDINSTWESGVKFICDCCVAYESLTRISNSAVVLATDLLAKATKTNVEMQLLLRPVS